MHSPLPLEMNRRSLEVQHAGRVILGASAGLIALGLVMVYSTSSAMGSLNGEAHSSGLIRQLRWVVLGIGLAWVVSRVPLEGLRRAARPVLTLAVVLLLMAVVLGPAVNGSRRWLHFAGMSLQPSEILKIGVLLYLADALSMRERARSFGHSTPLLPVLAPIGIGVTLVLVAPDLGTSLFIVAEAVVLLGLAGVRPTRFVPFALMVIPVIVVFAYTRFPHVRNRLAMYSTGNEAGTQVHEALVAIGSGGLLGKGLGEGAQKLGFFSEAHNDFIFAVIGEELGFLGCAAVVIGYMLLAWYGRSVAWRARVLGPHALYLAAGATFILVFQALINIAVVTATAPTKGVCLPFVSTGGSNFLMACTCLGIILNVARRTTEASPERPLEG
jgi:cell division protein FtsW